MKINSLTHSEELLMNILWKLNSAYMKDIMEQYPEPKPHQNTVSTFIKILVEKEFLTTEKEGRIFKYTVAVPYEDYRNFVLTHFLGAYYGNSGPELMRNLIEEQLVKTSDLNQFLDMNITALQNRAEEKENTMSDFIKEITSGKKSKKKKKKNSKKKKK